MSPARPQATDLLVEVADLGRFATENADQKRMEAPGPDAAGAILTADRYASIEVHDWRFGGRPS